MPSPFPGMDPYLEDPDLWPDVHAELIGDIRHHLAPKLRPRYIARVEQRTILFDPDDSADELYLVGSKLESMNPYEGWNAATTDDTIPT